MATNSSIFNYTLVGFFLLLLGFMGLSTSIAQPVKTAETLGLGNTGTAHIEGPAATSWNPANLMIQSRSGSFHLTLGNSALSFSSIFPNRPIGEQFSSVLDRYLPYKIDSQDITDQQRESILQRNYGKNGLQSSHRQRADVMIAGALWQQSDYAFSVTLRARYGSNNTVGRGWYDDTFVSQKDQNIRDFTLTQRRMELYELAFGYAQELTFVNGLLPGLNKLYIGITPKLIAATSHFSARYKGQYIRDENNSLSSSSFVSEFSLTSSGSNSRTVNSYRKSENAQQAIDNHLTGQYRFKPNGYGLGFDFGLNYVIQLGHSSTSFQSQHKTNKSLRIAFSLKDIGAVRFHDDFIELSSVPDSIQTQYQPPVNSAFIGAEGQYLDYLSRVSLFPNPLLNAKKQSSTNKTVLLPSSINTGILLDLSRVKFAGDLTIGLANTAFTTNNVALHLGMEVRPFHQIPIRLGTTLAKKTPLRIGFGTGLETKYWDFTVSGQALLENGLSETSVSGGAFGGFQFHF